jgi:anti-sigma regulatory factor (Ser/Thr protein kinase)
MGASLEARIQARLDAAAVARESLSRFEGIVSPDLYEDLRLVTSELVTNAVRHGAEAADVVLRVDASTRPVVVEVEDQGSGFVPRYPPVPQESSGWGLCLVDRLADRWGVSVGASGTRVWAELHSSTASVRTDERSRGMR